MRRHLIIALCFVPLSPEIVLQETKYASAPNVLFIALDDSNDWVGCLGGHPQARTPHIDRLAGSGVLFSNAHCAPPRSICLGSMLKEPAVRGQYSLGPKDALV